jgi:hypothetical protein
MDLNDLAIKLSADGSAIIYKPKIVFFEYIFIFAELL